MVHRTTGRKSCNDFSPQRHKGHKEAGPYRCLFVPFVSLWWKRPFQLFCCAIALLLLTVSAYCQAPAARIKIDTDRTIGEVDKNLFGNFAEHLGRMIYGGIYVEGSPLSDSDGYRTDVMEAVKQLGVSLLRYPGGNFSSGYDWKDGIGPKDQRPEIGR